MKKYLLSLLLLLLLVIFCFLNKTNEKYQAIIDFNSNRNNLKISFITELVNETEDDINKYLEDKIHNYNYFKSNLKDIFENHSNTDYRKAFVNYKKLLYILMKLDKTKNYTFDNIEVNNFDVSNILFMFDLFYFVNQYYKNLEGGGLIYFII